MDGGINLVFDRDYEGRTLVVSDLVSVSILHSSSASTTQ